MRASQLPYSSQTLKNWAIDHLLFDLRETDVLMDWISYLACEVHIDC
jgi:hypothetical protein